VAHSACRAGIPGLQPTPRAVKVACSTPRSAPASSRFVSDRITAATTGGG
jgi:hypothetical protein